MRFYSLTSFPELSDCFLYIGKMWSTNFLLLFPGFLWWLPGLNHHDGLYSHGTVSQTKTFFPEVTLVRISDHSHRKVTIASQLSGGEGCREPSPRAGRWERQIRGVHCLASPASPASPWQRDTLSVKSKVIGTWRRTPKTLLGPPHAHGTWHTQLLAYACSPSHMNIYIYIYEHTHTYISEFMMDSSHDNPLMITSLDNLDSVLLKLSVLCESIWVSLVLYLWFSLLLFLWAYKNSLIEIHFFESWTLLVFRALRGN